MVDAPSGDDEGSLCRSQQLRRPAHERGVARWTVLYSIALRRLYLYIDRLVVQHVPGNVDEHGPFLARHRDAECMAHQLGNALRRVDGHGVFGDRPKQTDVVRLLESISIDDVPGGRACYGDYGRVSDVGRVDTCREVRRPWTVGDQAYTETARDPGKPVGHEGSTLLVADADVPDVGPVVESVENVQEGAADDAEDVSNALGAERLHDRLARRHPWHATTTPPGQFRVRSAST